jgi:predicted DNA-binding transcriptional regulator YafY
MAKSKSKRLIDLLTLLLSARYPISRASIRRLEGYPRGEDAFHRQFERDKAALRALGFPIVDVGDDDEAGYVLERARLKLKEIRFTSEETVALALARRLGGMHALVGGRVRDALGKLGFVGAEADPLPGVFALAPPSHGKGEEERLRALEGAVLHRHRVRIAYRSVGEAAATTRELDPYGLYVHGGAWYVVGHDSRRDEVRTFRAGRIAKVTRTGRGAGADFAPPKDFRIADHVERMLERGWKGMTEEIVVRFAPGEAWRLSRLAGARVRVKRQADGAVDAHFRHTNPDALVSWVMAMGGGVVIESPQSARDEALRRLERAERVHAPTKAAG